MILFSVFGHLKSLNSVSSLSDEPCPCMTLAIGGMLNTNKSCRVISHIAYFNFIEILTAMCIGCKVIYVRCINCSYNNVAKDIRLLDKKRQFLFMQEKHASKSF